MEHDSLTSKSFSGRGQTALILGALSLSALLLRLMVAYTTVHFFDISFYVDWSAGVANDFYGAYNNISNLDYPPLFLFPLFITGKLLRVEAISEYRPYMMLALKGWQIVFDVALIPLLYRLFRRAGRYCGLVGAALWAVNPTIVINSSYWGQTDSLMIFLLVLAFLLLTEKKAVWAGVVMTLACMTKFQSLYFAPLFALALLTGFRLKVVLRSAAAGAVAALLVFAPFMARSGWLLPWEVYAGGFQMYPIASMNAFNLYGAAGLNMKPASELLFGLIPADLFSHLMIAAALVMLLAVWFTATEKSVWLCGFLFMQTIFLFTARMHERYQIPVLVFALAAGIFHRSRAMCASYLALTVMTFLNHFLVLEEALSGGKHVAWLVWFEQVVTALSIVNLLLYLVTAVFALHICYRKGANPPPRFWRREPPSTVA